MFFLQVGVAMLQVPTLIIAAASIDDIIAISAFSVTLSITFADAESGILIEILRAPLEVVLGLSPPKT